MNDQDLQNRFTFHPAAPDQAPRYEAIRARALELAKYVDELAPDGREKSLAVTKLEEVVFWANAAIARGEPHYRGQEFPGVIESSPSTPPEPIESSPLGPTPKTEDVAGGARRDDVDEQINAPAAADDDEGSAPATDERPTCTACNGAGCRACHYSGRSR